MVRGRTTPEFTPGFGAGNQHYQHKWDQREHEDLFVGVSAGETYEKPRV